MNANFKKQQQVGSDREQLLLHFSEWPRSIRATLGQHCRRRYLGWCALLSAVESLRPVPLPVPHCGQVCLENSKRFLFGWADVTLLEATCANIIRQIQFIYRFSLFRFDFFK